MAIQSPAEIQKVLTESAEKMRVVRERKERERETGSLAESEPPQRPIGPIVGPQR